MYVIYKPFQMGIVSFLDSCLHCSPISGILIVFWLKAFISETDDYQQRFQILFQFHFIYKILVYFTCWSMAKKKFNGFFTFVCFWLLPSLFVSACFCSTAVIRRVLCYYYWKSDDLNIGNDIGSMLTVHSES